MRIFLDANVLYSACRSAGAVRALLQLLEARGHVLVADAYVFEEARRNLQRKEGQGIDVLDALHQRMEVRAIAPDSSAPALAWLVEKDRPVLAAAIALRCDALMTGDKTHFGSRYGQTVEGVRLCSPAQLFQWIDE